MQEQKNFSEFYDVKLDRLGKTTQSIENEKEISKKQNSESHEKNNIRMRSSLASSNEETISFEQKRRILKQ